MYETWKVSMSDSGHQCFWLKAACKVLGRVSMILSFLTGNLQGWEVGKN